MNTKKIFYKAQLILMLALVLALLISCGDKFFDVNENPNNPPISSPKITLPVAEQELAQLNGTTMTYLGQFFMYNWSTPSNWSANEDLIRYNVTTDFYTSIFERSYSSIFKNLTYIENYEDPTGSVDYSSYKIIANVIKGFQYQYLVDLYGDIPYTEANLRIENFTPAYDDAQTIYKSLIDSLTNAASLALNLPSNAENPGTQDIIFGGNMKKWAQFANTIKLRMLIRLSNTSQDTYIKEQIALIDNNGVGYIEENVVANPGYTDANEQQSPFYGYFVRPITGKETDRSDFTVATDYTLNYLMGTNDNRYSRIYAESKKGGYKGAEQTTILPGTGFTSKDLSKVGPGLLVSAEQNQVIMLYSESLLLRAEAIVRGYISGTNDDAKNLYEKAIKSSFEYLGVDDAETAAETYYSQPLVNVSWDTSSDKIRAIITQKWIALNGTSSIEPWIEFTRTGYPSGLPTSVDSDGVRPVRLLYPDTEVSRNRDNVPSQTKDEAFTSYPFWK